MPNGGKNAHVATAPADQALKSVSHFLIAGMVILVEQGLGRKHPPIQAVTALEGLFLDERLLYRVGSAFRRHPFERNDLFSGCGRYGQRAGTRCAMIDKPATV